MHKKDKREGRVEEEEAAEDSYQGLGRVKLTRVKVGRAVGARDFAVEDWKCVAKVRARRGRAPRKFVATEEEFG